MKTSIAILALVIITFTACKKDKPVHPAIDTKQTVDTTTILLTRVIYNSNDSLKGRVAEVFSYNGKLLATDTTYNQDGTKTVWHFNYNTSRTLISVSVTDSAYPGIENTADVSINESHFNIGFLASATFISEGVSLDVENGQLTKRNYNTPFSYSSIVDTFTYNSLGNCVKDESVESIVRGHYGTEVNSTIIEYTAFDNKKNIAGALPFWGYGYLMLARGARLGFVPGKNNPAAYSVNGSTYNITYEYNSFGYPSNISSVRFSDGTNEAYKYEYMQAK